uniref:Alpha-amylase n=1 Tax=Blattella germanica TaxID=6973 RepID=Q2KJQ1_BLAGE|nr:1,4-alpha-D-glucan glucanohydrolase precursor [Blattella germanica]
MELIRTIGLFIILAIANAQKDPHALPGRSGIVHLFEWKFTDIATECENFLGPKGFAGVQVSPVHENLVVTTPNRPWWERYQVISYNITSRSGNESAFRDMVQRCNKEGVRIYVDVILDHMTSNYPNAHGVGGNTANPSNFEYPAIPYGPEDFHTPCAINNYNDACNVRNCELSGLHDLNLSRESVQKKMVAYLDTLIDAGVAGLRVDAAKHMWPSNLQILYNKVKNLNTSHGFPNNARPFFFQEVIDQGGEAIHATEYTEFGRVTEFKYGRELSNAFRGNNAIKWLKNFGPEWGFIPDGDAVVFVDNHDNQRGHGGAGSTILTHTLPKLYKMATAFMLSHPYGYPRIMSSYSFSNSDQGPPQDAEGNIISPSINNDGACNNSWICEHRWRQIYNMIKFRNIVTDTAVNNWWDNGDKQIAFSRGDKGFIAFNNQYNTHLMHTLQTPLPAGLYCDITSGSKNGSSCTGKTVTVENDGTAYIQILSNEQDGVLALHLESKL